MAITITTALAEAAGITARTRCGRSFFATVEGEQKPRYRLWTDAPYPEALANARQGAREHLRRRDIIIEVGPPGRRAS